MSASHLLRAGQRELGTAISASRNLLIAVALFSAFANLLVLTGPLFMLQVYDRVLSSGSVETLTALFLLVTGLFLLFGVLDFARGRLMARVGARAHTILSHRVDEVSLRDARSGGQSSHQSAPQDLSALQRALSGASSLVIFDVPWAPVFLAAMFLFHPWLGILGIAGGVVMVAITVLNQWRSRPALAAAHELDMQAELQASAARQQAGTIKALGMRESIIDRITRLRQDALAAGVRASDRSGAYASASKAMRFYLQSAILALGAALAIAGQITPGAMIAASILMGRALAPVEQGIAQWPVMQRGLTGWRRLKAALSAAPVDAERTPLPRPRSEVSVRNLAVATPVTKVLSVSGVSFDLAPGEALGVIGQSASGKSSLTRALVNIWEPAAGTIRLGGATFDQWPSDALGALLGYLPQDVSLLSGTVAENIGRMQQPIDAAAVITAAQAAGAHEMILRLPQGYETKVGQSGQALSGGQRQRIGLARALFGDPALVILDEPNAHLDAEGELALLSAIKGLKERDRAVIVMAHRPNAIAACDRLLVLEKGRQRAYGTRDEILREYTKARTRVVAKAMPQVAAQGGQS